MGGRSSIGWAAALGAGLGILIAFGSLLGGVIAQSQVVNVTSNVTISAQLAVASSYNLSRGIPFGNFTTLPQTDLDSIDLSGGVLSPNNNSNSTDPIAGIVGAGNTSYYVNVSESSNVNSTICISANDSLRTSDGLSTISNTGFTWNASARHGNGTWLGGGPPGTPSGYVAPQLSTNDMGTTAYETKGGLTNISVRSGIPTPGNATAFFRFWLDIPSTTNPGSFFNTVSFKVVRDTNGCGSYP